MITKTEEIQAEIIVAIQDSFSAYGGDGFEYSQQEILDYLEECFAAKNKLASQQSMLDATILSLYSACDGSFSDYCEDDQFGNEHLEWLAEQHLRIKKKK